RLGNKNKTNSATSTPAHSPRSSTQIQRSSIEAGATTGSPRNTMTFEQALEKIMEQSVSGAITGPSLL
ncbi:hypothetical protein BGW38_004092, partial [Lunasporangiospora selenospora]